ncbi:MAG: molybdate ABC transporter permease subunit [SAR202 cluster bacterium]|nr:molybdate ABC transporter permease subunit [SAR202 cluster bacterium]
MIWPALLLSLQVTAVATALLFAAGLPLALLLARLRFRGRVLVETLVLLPLVLPPSVVGYYLLIALGRDSPLVQWFGINLLFTWQGAALAAAVVGLPLMVQAARAAIAEVSSTVENAARTLGASELEVLGRVTLPLARRGILAGLLLGAARAISEFGATLMVAGSIPGRTQTMPLAIYDAVQNRQYDLANQMVLIMTALAFLALWLVRQAEYSQGLSPAAWFRSALFRRRYE